MKKYGNSTIIGNLSLSIKEGEFFTLLGPSGCGKTTLLRMIAGFNSIENGDFFFNDVRINDMDPVKRNIGMVFQNYAIFPNMTVEKNVAFGLKNRKLPGSVIKEKTTQFLKLMKIYEFKDRMPERLSGGQQQRVALARALAITPDVLLMDEPLSNLDAKLRVEMRSAIREIQNNLGITTVYVTHDQEEAMAVSDRIAVMNLGEIQQIGTPRQLYQRPSNLFVATFIGHTNVIRGKLEIHDGLSYVLFPTGHSVEVNNINENEVSDRDIDICIRPEEFVVNKKAQTGIPVKVDDAVFLGLNTHYFVHFETGEKIEIVQESEIDDSVRKGDVIYLAVKADKINLFDSKSGRTIMKDAVSGV